MEKHSFKEEPLHDIIGRPNTDYPEVELMCGHIDLNDRAVCLLIAAEHHKMEKDFVQILRESS
jgi:hypothetical protein